MNRKILNKHHFELVSEAKANAREIPRDEKEKRVRYIGTNKTCYVLGADTEKRIIKEWIERHSDLSMSQYVELLSSLYQGESINEISMAGELLESLPRLRKNVEPKYVDVWLNRLHGWAEVDSLCQSKFAAAEVLGNWKEWKGLLTKLTSNKNVHKRRASLVLLTKPVRDSEDSRLADLAFMNIDRLKNERDNLVTKAVSWLLRDLIKHNRHKVEGYLKENEDALPKIALRETKIKLLTGRKTSPHQRQKSVVKRKAQQSSYTSSAK